MSKDSNKPLELYAMSTSPRHLPPDWNPPAPAWAASFEQQTTPVVMAYFGTQLKTKNEQRTDLQLQEFFASGDAPDNLENAAFIDRAGYRNLISSAYWTDPADYEQWREKSGFEAWWSDQKRLDDRRGHYREVLTVPPSRFETIFSYNCQVGVAKTGGCPVVGRRLRINVPENLAVIRSGQDWTDCAGTELAQYDDSVRPALVEGMTFLRDHPDETGCCDLRFADETSHDGAPLKKSFGLGYFLTLGHLEKWAATHPTHLAIFSKFLTMAREHGANLKLKLWHEVSVLPAAGQVFEYVNCHPGTGLLPYFVSEEW